MRSLLKTGALLGAIVAVIIMIVLPAERGIDVTGFGRLIGLTEMGEIKVEIADELAAEAALAEKFRIADSADVADSIAVARGRVPATGARTDTITVILPPLGSAEIRLAMQEGERVSYSWSTQTAAIDFTVIGDSLVANSQFHIYNAGKGRTGKTGVIVALFNGEHGWYWRSLLDDTVTVRLRTEGTYFAIRNAGENISRR